MNSLTPEQVQQLLAGRPGAVIYLAGIGGCGVSGLAHLLLDAGFSVHGSDLAENAETRQLRARGATIHVGHRAEQVRTANPMLLVFSPAVASDNPELVAARELAVPIIRRAVLLAALHNSRRGLAVAGMHGKTTTSAWLAFVLEQLGHKPGYAIGALVPQLQPHARLNQDAQSSFVIEADESDGTLPLYEAAHAILLNLDSDHLDHFGRLENIVAEFSRFVARVRGLVVFCADDSVLAEMMSRRSAAVSYGFNALAQYRAELHPRQTGAFVVWHRGQRLGEFTTRLLGPKSVLNATAVIALLHQLGFAPEELRGAVAAFAGTNRRQQELFSSAGVRVFDDYGHHPSEIMATVAALRELRPRRLVVAFQPHRYTRTMHLLEEFAGAFGGVDRLFLTEVYAASEAPIPGANAESLAAAIRARGQEVELVAELADLVPALEHELCAGDLVLFLGAGDITKAAHAFAERLRQGNGPGPELSLSMNASSPSERFSELRALLDPSTLLLTDEPLARRTTMRVGGKADFFVEPASESDLSAVLRFCQARQLPFMIIGRGSNLLVRDGGIRGVVISLGHDYFSRLQITGEHLHCGAGAKLKTVSVEARRAGLAGLEFLEGIPGSVGGALRMNAGAMGSWMFEVVERIRFMDYAGQIQERQASEVNVEYRGCPLFKTHIALGAVLRGTTASKEVIQERAGQFNAKRWESQPAQPSAGCIFKNPKTVPAGKLIDELGLKGTRRGGAMISPIHGNFIVNEGNATARDVLELIEFVKQTAREKRGIELHTEVEIIGE